MRAKVFPVGELRLTTVPGVERPARTSSAIRTFVFLIFYFRLGPKFPDRRVIFRKLVDPARSPISQTPFPHVLRSRPVRHGSNQGESQRRLHRTIAGAATPSFGLADVKYGEHGVAIVSRRITAGDMAPRFEYKACRDALPRVKVFDALQSLTNAWMFPRSPINLGSLVDHTFAGNGIFSPCRATLKRRLFARFGLWFTVSPEGTPTGTACQMMQRHSVRVGDWTPGARSPRGGERPSN